MTKEIINTLLRKIWITRKCRIIASERLEKIEFYSQFIFIYYSIILTSLSIWSFVPEHSNYTLSFISIIASIGLLCGSLFITSRNYKNRSIALKSCYIELDHLYTKLQLLDINNMEENLKKQEILEIENSYLKLLNDVENHSEFDYLKVAIQNPKDISLNANQKIKYYFYILCYIILIIFFFILPLIPIIFFY